ncbi:MAG: hypothetical protein ABI434_14765 [Burkholderiaceae bacterium]
MYLRFIPILAITLLSAGCDLSSLLGPDPRVVQRDADGRAIGAACRHAMRGLEDCYKLNERSPKTAIFDGWKEMDGYMRENKIEGVASKIEGPTNSSEVMLTDSTEAKKAASH